MQLIEKLYDSLLLNEQRISLETSNHSWTARELLERSRRVAATIKRMGLLECSNIAIHVNNDPFFIYCMLGILQSGHRVVPIPYNSSSIEINTIVASCEISLCFSKSAKPQGGEYEQVAWISDCLIESTDETEKAIASVADHDPALLLSTSGTTGKAKIVALSHHNVLTNAWEHGNAVGYTSDDTFLISMPMHFSSTIITQIVSGLLHGVKLVLVPLPLLPRIAVNLIYSKPITGFSGVPTLFLQIISEVEQSNHPPLENVLFIVVSGAALSDSLFKRLKKVFIQADILQTYGLTEASPRVTMMRRGDSELSCGYPIRDVAIRIADESNSEIERGSVGEVQVKGPNVMLGYYNNEVLTKEIIIDGWLKTGDLGLINKEGCLVITGRKKNIIITGGMNVYPEEVEDLLSSFEVISEVVVMGSQDKLLGEIPIAFISVTANQTIDIKQLQRQCFKVMSVYKVPRVWYILDSVPKTKTGKLDRSQLKAMLENDSFQPAF